MSDLLPSNSTELEKKLAKTGIASFAQHIPIRDLHDPYTCPAPLLPYLAWAWSVDYWDVNWSEAKKRNYTAKAWDIHRKKGTIGAIKLAIDSLDAGFSTSITEWWQKLPQGIPGTIEVSIANTSRPINNKMYAEITRLINQTKPVAKHLAGLNIKLASKAKVIAIARAIKSDLITVYPYIPNKIIIENQLLTGGGIISANAISIKPR